MNPSYADVIAASDADRLDLFLQAARELGTTAQNVEKDFWVCWTLDALFNGRPADAPRLLFKGGTSLAKAFGLIARFSEDIDVTVFRDDLGEDASLEALEALSRKKREAKLDDIKAKAQAYIVGDLREGLHAIIKSAMEAAGIEPGRARLEPDKDDPDGQTLLFWYPAVVTRSDAYIRSAVKIESGAKSALDPNASRQVTPFVEVPGLDLGVAGVTTVDAERTFWDKVVILHGLKCWYDRRGVLYHGGQRISRHYYDVHRLLLSEAGDRAVADLALGAECVRHARLFFNRPDFDLASAEPGRFALVPSPDMAKALEADYGAMQGMIFGEAPPLASIIESIADLEVRLNG